MKYYIRYISKNLTGTALIVAFSLTSIVWLTQALRFVDFIVNRGVSVGTFLKLTALIVPSLLYIVLPLTMFVAVVFIYSKLLGDSELVVLQNAGLSRWQISKPVIVTGIGAVMLAYFISLYALPVTYRQFKDMQTFLRDNYASMLLQEEVFNTPMEGMTVFVRSRDPQSGLLQGILVHDNRDIHNPVTMMAQRGQLLQTRKGPRFQLYEGNRQEVKDGRLSYLKFDSYSIDLSFYAKAEQARNRKPEELFLHELFTIAEQQPERSGELLAEAHQRIVWPLYNLVLALFAAAMLLKGQFNRRGNWRRVTASALSAIGMIGLGLSLQNIIAENVMLVPLVYSTLIAWLVLDLWLLYEGRHPVIPPAPPQMIH
jgi:lipopolysaccharide export system permease protein